MFNLVDYLTCFFLFSIFSFGLKKTFLQMPAYFFSVPILKN